MTRVLSRMGRSRMGQRLTLWMGVVSLGVCLWGAPATAQEPSQPRPPAATDEFVPISEIPDHDKLPAAPFLIGAYTVAWLAVLLYVYSLWRRLARVEEELKRLAPGSSRP